jgi:demethylmenaquinone methyltransferase/2-methoxy-6-polyprenyl-1,4-benzoquinol methylase
MTGETRDALIPAGENRRMFDAIAGRYDLMNAVMSLGLHRSWRRRAVTHLLSRGAREILDVGCGTGDVALAVMRKDPAARVTGLDPARKMLAIAETKARRAGLAERATYREGDATALPFGDARIDGIVCAFCLRNITDRACALREMRRVLRPGGTLAILELTAPQQPFFKIVHRVYTRRLIPLMGRLLSQGPAYRYLADSIDHFPPAPVIVNELRQAGFPGAARQSLTFGFVSLFTDLPPGSHPASTP